MKKILIDGNNLIHSDPHLRSLFKDDIEAAENIIVQKIVNFLINSKNEATIFFDGINYSRSFSSVSPNVYVKYAKNKTADDAIRIAIEQEKNKRKLIVVSSDSEHITNFAKKCGCEIWSSNDFLKRINQNNKTTNPKFEGKISEKEIEYFKNIFSQSQSD